ncbi:hypothetical protein [Streptomyces sp. YGL11-2]|uniref:hypothetical protein n=1 Tax=Streptomyces sp. YGL11-2 TaxID=3414028 RepID=UPI003CF04154
MPFPSALLPARAERITDRTPRAAADPVVLATVHTVCDQDAEPRVRDRLAQALSAHGIEPHTLRTRPASPETVLVEADFTTEGSTIARLARLITLVWLDPAVHDLHWCLDSAPRRRPAPRPLRAGGLVVGPEGRTPPGM